MALRAYADTSKTGGQRPPLQQTFAGKKGRGLAGRPASAPFAEARSAASPTDKPQLTVACSGGQAYISSRVYHRAGLASPGDPLEFNVSQGVVHS
jgi:hypothetical protein